MNIAPSIIVPEKSLVRAPFIPINIAPVAAIAETID